MLVRIYTDGACSDNPGPGGWSVVIYLDVGFKVISGYDIQTTNNRMELTAVIKAFEYIIKNHNKHDRYEIYSDSAYVVNAIEKDWVTRWKLNDWSKVNGECIKNKKLWKRLYKLLCVMKTKFIDFSIVKVSGHSGNTFNDYADTIAKQQRDIAKLEFNKQAGNDI